MLLKGDIAHRVQGHVLILQTPYCADIAAYTTKQRCLSLQSITNDCFIKLADSGSIQLLVSAAIMSAVNISIYP